MNAIATPAAKSSLIDTAVPLLGEFAFRLCDLNIAFAMLMLAAAAYDYWFVWRLTP